MIQILTDKIATAERELAAFEQELSKAERDVQQRQQAFQAAVQEYRARQVRLETLREVLREMEGTAERTKEEPTNATV